MTSRSRLSVFRVTMYAATVVDLVLLYLAVRENLWWPMAVVCGLAIMFNLLALRLDTKLDQ